MKLIELQQYLNNYLNVPAFHDYCPNGLQIAGRQELSRIVTGVTASQALIDKAIDLKADALIVHHGYFWKNEAPCLVGVKYHRIKSLLMHDISLLAYHLPLDAHEIVGNNVQLAALLDLHVQGEIPVGMGKNILLYGHTEMPIMGQELAKKIEKMLERAPLYIEEAHRPIKALAWCTGGGQDFIEQAASFGVDAFLTGEVSERTVHLARELKIDFFAAGHHATERYGIKALGEHLAAQFNLDVSFIDIDNPV